MISTDQIDNLFDYFYENESKQEKLFIAFSEKQEHISAWLLGEQFEVLTSHEQDYLYFLGMTIWLAFSKYKSAPRVIEGEEIREAEERLWTLLEEKGNLTYNQKMDLMFEDTTEEDLMAFVEDSLVEDPDDDEKIITSIGREPMAVALKAMIDVFSKAS
jgi:hypothetical protein